VGRNIAELTRAETGQIGEAVAANMLRQNGFTEVYALTNASGHGIDLVGRNAAGQWIAVEVKASRTGSVGELSVDQGTAVSFISTRLERATAQSWGLQGGPAAEAFARQARAAWEANPSSFQRIAVGVDLRTQTLRINQWR
jgi:Holliday junction resolvase-like predicted endonuclease